MKRLFLSLFCILTFSLCGEVLAKESMSQKGFTIKTVEDLYVLCKQAKEEYKDNPEEIGNSVCGAYIQGSILGFTVGGMHSISHVRGWEAQFLIIDKMKKYFCNKPETIDAYIEQFIVWKEKNNLNLSANAESYAGFWESVSSGCSEK